MSFNNDQNEPNVPIGGGGKRETSSLLPRYYRTRDNKKFLQGTLDQLTQPGTVKKITGYLGRASSKATASDDIFLSASDKDRQDYQLEPAAVIKDYLGNTTFYKDYIDYINFINVNDGNTVNHARLNSQEFYSWKPHIDWDKFVNFQQYYWLPFGPEPIAVSGQQLEVISEYTVKGVDEEDNVAYLFTPNGLTRNPTITLFREQTYVFDIDAEGHPFSIKTERVEGNLFRYNKGVDIQAVEKGKITFKVPKNAPDVLFYVSENAVDTGGVFQILDIEENTYLDLERDILGKKNYVIPNGTAEGIALSNGMKLSFEGKVYPEVYGKGYWYVEGVGSAIKLISERALEIRSTYVEEQTLLFDDLPFDQLPFSETGTFPLRQDYITINRSSLDNNPWSRYNRWFHQSVIVTSATVNGKQPELNQTARATRPIIEFNPNIKLHNYGISTKDSVDVIDNFTTDVFSTIEGSLGYAVDGIDLANGMRVLFTADPDILVRNKIFKVNFIDVWISGREIEFNPQIAIDLLTSQISFTTEHGLTTGNQVTYLQNAYTSIPGLVNREVYYVETVNPFTIKLYKDKALTKAVEIFNTSNGIHKFEFFQGFRRQINLTEETDATPNLYECVAVRFGNNDTVTDSIKGNQGQNYWYDGTTWKLCQVKTGPNVPPLFDVFDENGVSYSDTTTYEGSNFAGTKIFSYKVGSGTNDSTLGFPLSHKNINNVGDIVFNFNLLSDAFSYKEGNLLTSKSTDVGYLKVSSTLDTYELQNGWEISKIKNAQPIVRIFKNSNIVNNFPIDVFDGKQGLEDLSLSIQIKFDAEVDTSFVELTDDVTKFVTYYRNKKAYLRIVDDRVSEFSVAKITYSSPQDSTVYEKELIGLDINQDIELTNYVAKLDVRVYINGKRLDKNSYIIQDGIIRKSLILDTDVSTTDIVTLRIFSKKSKNANGHYEIPINLQNNPLNDGVSEFTLGQVIDHVDSIIDNISDFVGTFPGQNNLRDLGSLTPYGTRFVQHSGSLNLPLYHFGSKSANIIKAMDQAKADYGRFKRAFLIAAENTGLELDPKRHVDYILQQLAKDKPKTNAYYLSDMFGYTATTRLEINVLDPRTKVYPLSAAFNLKKCSNKAVNIYVNGLQAVHGRDYVFGDTEFFSFTSSFELVEGDLIEIYEYESTDGCYCPPTPTKLGLYPKYEPRKYFDNSYLEPTEVIQGHDGNVTIAYGDYRDDLLLELERRIFNNIKTDYNPAIFDLFNYIPGHSRETAYTTKEFNDVISKYFYQWTQNIPQDYTKNDTYSFGNGFTYNFKENYTPDGKVTPGGWRGIYRWLFDTDVPNLKPWEALGFSIQPSWWETVYGPAPYTSDNLVLWEDLRDGRIKEPGKPARIDLRFARAILNYGVPVDQDGNLVAPNDAGFALGFLNKGDENFVFGDEYTVEAAWRRSSYYPFAVIQALLLMHPAEVFSRCFDRSRIVKNAAGQLVYAQTDLRMRLQDVVIPSNAITETSSRNFACGLINYITDYLTFERTDRIEQYSTDLKTLTNNISTRLGGFTSKEKYKLLLDSKSPNSSGGVFVPSENYFVDLNVSTAVKKVVYSGIIVTKYSDGYELRGYDFDSPYFSYYDYRTTGRNVRVGGISESFSTWDSGKTYVAGKIVQVGNTYYRALVNHVSGDSFDDNLYAKLAGLPIVGGVSANLRANWDKNTVKKIAYGTKVRSIQEVVDIMQGYGVYLEDQGFVFNDFNTEVASVANWETSIKEFLFWVSQGWDEGSVLSLSPSANKITFRSNNAVVDNLVDSFYGYGIYRVDGQKLDPDFIDVYRGNGEFTVEPRNTEYGIYGAALYLVQKEHVVVLDDVTLFNDTVYDKPAGYRQEKIKAVGYVTSNWNGSFDIPGFIYDRAVINAWEPWTDYRLGDIVKYKEFYYSAKKFLVGVETFDSDDWVLLEEKPKAELLPNWDYRAEQFTDFYDLDTDNFDSEQQRLAQHLTGYQKRQYLENIINNDVSQYKFYQGMIAEKGTQNVLSKLFDVLSEEGQESLTFDEEWAFRTGEYGSLDTFDEVEFILDESQFKISPQPLEIVDNIDPSLPVDYVYRQLTSDIYVKPKVLSKDIWKKAKLPNYLRTPGYVRREDVKVSVNTLADLVGVDISSYKEGDYVWTAFEGISWNVYRLTKSNFRIVNVTVSGSEVTVEFNKIPNFKVGDVFGIEFAAVANDAFGRELKSYPLKGFHVVTKVSQNDVTFVQEDVVLEEFTDRSYILAYELHPFRAKSIDDANELIPAEIKHGETLWVDDNGQGDWAVYKYAPKYSRATLVSDTQKTNLKFGGTIAITESGNIAAVSGTTTSGATTYGGITLYQKTSSDNRWVSAQLISPPVGINFENVVCKFSRDGKVLVIAYPNASSNVGILQIYEKRPAGYDLVFDTVGGTAEKLGSNLEISKLGDDYLLAAATVSKVTIFKGTYNSETKEYTWEESDYVSGATADIAIADNGTLITSLVDGNGIPTEVRVYTYQNGYSNADQVLSESVLDDGDLNYGVSISISKTGSYIAVGASLANKGIKNDTGRVYVYKFDGSTYALHQEVFSRYDEVNEQFGTIVEFMNDDQSLVIYSLNSNIDRIYELSDGTTFDNNTLRIVDRFNDVGRVDVYDRYNSKFIYGETLESSYKFDTEYGKNIAVSRNTILVSAAKEDVDGILDQGIVYSYVKPVNKFSWEVLHKQSYRVDVRTIKKAFLYDQTTKQIVKYLDVIDPTQGKIAGIADQEIKFKGYYDPAIYTVGDGEVTVDNGLAWTENQVGMLWWDMTNARFLDIESGDVVYKSTAWNTLYDTATIDIYEWVESSVPPASWDEQVGTEAGIALGINGTTKYGSSVYSVKRKYDNVSQTFVNTYYFWVKNKITVPAIEGRTISASDVARLIADPAGYGYSCLAFTDSNSISFVNIARYLQNKDIVLSVQFWTSDYRENNYHSQWKLLSTNRNTTIPAILEDKWFHSLLGKDSQDRPIPDIKLPEKMRYGIEYRPRQSMFVNRVEALKQYIERVNAVLKDVLITDNYDISPLMSFDSPPSQVSGKWDAKIDTEKELRFINTTQVKKPVLTVNTVDGKVTGINIIDPGYGFVKSRAVPDTTDRWYGTDIVITGQGSGAVVKSIVNSNGEIVNYEIVEPGADYDSYTYADVRDFTVLVGVDTVIGSWAMYSLDSRSKNWYLSKVQAYDVTQYWEYIDWYATGYSQFTKVDNLLANTYELVTTDIEVGSVVKVANIGSGGWVLLEKYNDLDTIDYTENFKVVGREKGTIQFLDIIYAPTKGYDRELLDSLGYDNYNTENLRIILNTVRDKLLVDDLRVEYLKLFFSSVRYAMHEQVFVDWAIKTSFVKAQHNVGTLKQKPTYNSDNLEFFEEYIKEVKPYRTKVREYVSNYSAIDPSRSSVTDFDLLPVIDLGLNVKPLTVTVDDETGKILTNYTEIDSYPWKHWKDTVGFEITTIKIVDQGAGYIQAPVVKIEGVQFEGGTPAKAKAYISSGRVNRIELISPGTRWVKAPTVIIEGGLTEDTGSGDTSVRRNARAVAIIGNTPVRTNHIKIKFDRTNRSYQVTTLDVEETFTGSVVSGSRVQFPLKWSPNIEFDKYRVVVNGAESLKNEYYLKTVESTSAGYTRYSGLLVFDAPPAAGSTIIVYYKKNFDHLTAVDRINFFYDPQTGQVGKDLGQLMTGIDYGGVAITGLDLGLSYGWDSLPWFSDAWDVEDLEFDDYTVTVPATPVYQYLLPFVPAENEQINVYVSRYSAIPEKIVFNAALVSTTDTHYRVRITTTAEHNLAINQAIVITSNLDPDFEEKIRVYFVKSETEFDILVENNVTLDLSKYNKVNGELYSEYMRIDDPAFKTVNQSNENAVMTTFIGDGEIDFINLPDTNSDPSFELFEKDRLVFRKVTSDGSRDANPDDYDTKLSGGDFAYTTAVGINPDDIILDGDGLVTPMTSHAPEEIVPGQIMDTLAIKVYSRPTGGAPNIMFKTYKSDGVSTSYVIGQHAPNNASIIVKVEDQILDVNVDYTIDYLSNTIVLTSPALEGDNVSIVSVNFGGSSILDLDFFVADGETVEYITKASWTSNFNITVLVNGSVLDYTLFSTDESYTQASSLEPWRARVGIKFSAPPPENAIINYIVDDSGIERTASVVKSETLTYNAGQDTYVLTNQVGKNVPFEPSLLVSVNDSILASPSYSYYTLEKGKRVYSLNDSRYENEEIVSTDLKVYLENSLLSIGKDYTVTFNDSTAYYSADPDSLVITSIGAGYAVGDILTLQDSSTNKLKVVVIEANTLGEILAAKVSSLGQYTVPPSGTLNLVTEGGPIRGIALGAGFDGGLGYVSPEIEFSTPEQTWGYPARGKGIVDANGTITSVVILDPGSGYTSAPTATAVVETSGSTPTALANLAIEAVYSSGSGATCTVDFVLSQDLDKVSISVNRKYAGTKYAGKQLIIGVTKFADYSVGTNSDLTLLNQYANGSTIKVTTFYNHNVLELQRTVDHVSQVVEFTQGTPNYYEFTGKMGGIFKLDETVLSGNHVWVVKNGELLIHQLDYFLEADRRTVRLVEYLGQTDVVQIIAFTNVVVNDNFGFMQFKDMMNRTHYKRLNKAKATRLAQDLNQYDREIFVEDGSVLESPNPLLNLPGIIEINGERIEYFAKTGNTLSRLTRATLGTGAPATHAAGTVVQGLGAGETVPYKDTFLTETFVSDGVSTEAYYDIPYNLDITGLKSYQYSSDLVEVFVGGYRLKKNEYVLYHESNEYPYSPVVPLSTSETTKEGDKRLAPEFLVPDTSTIRLNFIPPVGTKIVIVKKQGHLWNDIVDGVGLRLADSTNPIATFVKSAETVWPE